MKRRLIFALLLCLATLPASAQVPNLGLYLSQSVCPDGSPPLAITAACPILAAQKASDPIFFRRGDGVDQITDSVVDTVRYVWNHTWSYPPYGGFTPANGDGGEIFTTDGTTVWICCTQDISSPTITNFGKIWGLYNAATVPCSLGWTQIDAYSRACRATVTYVASGYGLTKIIADSIINEHFGLPGQQGNLERHFLAAGWGVMYWDSWNDLQPPGSFEPEPTGGPPASTTKHKWGARLWTKLIPQAPSVTAFGWPPTGWVPK